MQVKTCVEEVSRSVELSGHSTYVASPWHTDYTSRYVEKFAETYASGLDPVQHLRCHPGEGKKWVRRVELIMVPGINWSGDRSQV
eukprot:229311-Ditylum_brightwellii.AAC.2